MKEIYNDSSFDIKNDLENNINDNLFSVDDDNILPIDNYLKLYIQDISKKPLLTREEEINLAIKVKQGDENARNELVERNARLVVWVAKKYIGSSLSFIDLIQEGNFGLIKASYRYDIDFKTRFSTYAVQWIHQCIRRAIHDQGRMIRLPVHIHELMNKIKRKEEELVLKLNHYPTIEEIFEEFNGEIPIEKIKKVKMLTNDVTSLDIPIKNHEDILLIDFLGDKSIPNPAELAKKSNENKALYNALYKLTEKEQRVIILRFGLNDNKVHTLEEIGEILSLTRERIRQIQSKAIIKLKNIINPEQFLD